MKEQREKHESKTMWVVVTVATISSVVIVKWSVELLRETGANLLDIN